MSPGASSGRWDPIELHTDDLIDELLLVLAKARLTPLTVLCRSAARFNASNSME